MTILSTEEATEIYELTDKELISELSRPPAIVNPRTLYTIQVAIGRIMQALERIKKKQ